MSFSNIYFVLFKPQLPENIGFCARALKNFNFSNLSLVSPKINFPNKKVLATSVGAKDVIKASKVYANLEDAIQNVNYVIGTSSRIRKRNYKYLTIKDLNKINFKKKIAFIFGPEASGLSNNELSYANYVIKLPTNKNFESLNLCSLHFFLFGFSRSIERDELGHGLMRLVELLGYSLTKKKKI